MRPQYHFRESEQGLLVWDVSRLIRLSRELPIIEIDLQSINEIDETFWYALGGAIPTCRNVVEHASLINNADLSYPIILCEEARVMDGMHRVCKALMLKHSMLKAVQFERYIAPDYIDVKIEDLP